MYVAINGDDVTSNSTIAVTGSTFSSNIAAGMRVPSGHVQSLPSCTLVAAHCSGLVACGYLCHVSVGCVQLWVLTCYCVAVWPTGCGDVEYNH